VPETGRLATHTTYTEVTKRQYFVIALRFFVLFRRRKVVRQLGAHEEAPAFA
jgi:hypothetical protein